MFVSLGQFNQLNQPFADPPILYPCCSRNICRRRNQRFYDVPSSHLHISINAARQSKSRLIICSLLTSAIFIQRCNYHMARALSIFLKPSSTQPTLCRSPKLHRHQMSHSFTSTFTSSVQRFHYQDFLGSSPICSAVGTSN